MKRADRLIDDVDFPKLSPDDQAELLKKFDADFYLRENPELELQNVDLLSHYLTVGWREGRDPSRDFRTIIYLLANRDALRRGMNPLIHQLLISQGRLTHPDPVMVSDPIADVDPAQPICEPSVAAPRVLLKTGHTKVVLEGSRDPANLEVQPTGLEGLTPEELAELKAAFDQDYYLRHNIDLVMTEVDPFRHYMKFGWRELRDPSAEFSTGFYLRCHEDIAKSKMNPFVHWVLHGKEENRAAISFQQKLEKKQLSPTIAAIIPNYNHADFLAERIDSILAQTYPAITITILDDCSSDHSRDVIDSYVARFPQKISAIYNTSNSGGVFYQWRKGVQGTDSDLIWICESDDFCEPDFIANLVPFFRDESVNIAFGRILETDREGVPNLSLDDYRERSEAGIWADPLVRPAAAWFANAFGVNNVIANVGGCIFRRHDIPDAVWEEAQSYSVVGDWYLYNEIAGGGQIAWSPAAVSYFRRHGSNTSSNSFTGTKFYHELERLMMSLLSCWDIPAATLHRFYENIANQYDYFDVAKQHGPLEDHCSLTKLLHVERSRPHILLAIYGFIPGGGENFPIHLANTLVARGMRVSILVFETKGTNDQMRAALSSSVAVYDAAWLFEYGADRFLKEAGVSLIHSHTVGAEMHFLYLWKIQTNVRYMVTLHGSYEASDLPCSMLETMMSGVDQFVYTAEKNLKPFEGLSVSPQRVIKLPNAMPVDAAPFPKTRAQLGIPHDAVVFTLVARGIRGKGWHTAISAFNKLRKKHADQALHLCLVGDGDVPKQLKTKFGSDPNIHFLGYQLRINGLYRMTDVAIVPTRFSGESYPLCIIQALQEGTPVIASDVGEIGSMLKSAEGREAGLLIEAAKDDRQFVANLVVAMEKMLDADVRRRFANGARVIGEGYDMEKLVEVYEDIYSSLLSVPSKDPWPAR